MLLKRECGRSKAAVRFGADYEQDLSRFSVFSSSSLGRLEGDAPTLS